MFLSRRSVKKLAVFLPFIALSIIILSAFDKPSIHKPKAFMGKGISESAKWALDKSKSSVSFNVTHMVVSEVEGTFKVFNGSIESTKPDFSDAKIEFSVDVKSINTNNENRDKHLRSEDFFYTTKFPSMNFVSTSFTKQDGNDYKLAGNLTIRNVTKPVVFSVNYGGLSSDQKTATFEAKTTIDRFDYDLKWSKMTEAGGLVVSKDVKVIVKASFKVK